MISEDTEIKALVNMALSSTDLTVAVGALVRARLLRPTGRLEAGLGFISGHASPKDYYAERRKLIEGQLSMEPPQKLSDIAEMFSCSLSTVCEIKKEMSGAA